MLQLLETLLRVSTADDVVTRNDEFIDRQKSCALAPRVEKRDDR
ncbi:hypothetical protein [Agreia bicolorata]|nr:hypothetical protein [Agreia bicolorata]